MLALQMRMACSLFLPVACRSAMQRSIFASRAGVSPPVALLSPYGIVFQLRQPLEHHRVCAVVRLPRTAVRLVQKVWQSQRDRFRVRDRRVLTLLLPALLADELA